MSNLNVGDNYTASQKELIVATIVVTKDGGRGSVTIYSIDSNGDEVILGQASVHEFNASDAHVPYNSVSVLVDKNEQYKVVQEQQSGTINTYAYFRAI